MIPVYSSALKDNEIDVTDLPMPRILGEGEEEPKEVWTASANRKNLPIPKGAESLNITKDSRGWAVYETKEAALKSGAVGPYPVCIERVLRMAKEFGYVIVLLIDESYTVIETWRV